MKQKTQIIYIHGGMTFSTQKKYLDYLTNKKIYLEELKIWPETLQQKLPKFQIIKPRMPNKDNAQYKEWKIIFEKYLKETNKKIILIGFSLGAIFLLKYLSENQTNKDILQTHLIAPTYDDKDSPEELSNGFKLKTTNYLKKIQNLNLYFSKTDPIININQAEIFRKKIPNAKITIYKDKNGHFITKNFPELIKKIKNN